MRASVLAIVAIADADAVEALRNRTTKKIIIAIMANSATDNTSVIARQSFWDANALPNSSAVGMGMGRLGVSAGADAARSRKERKARHTGVPVYSDLSAEAVVSSWTTCASARSMKPPSSSPHCAMFSSTLAN